MLGHAAQAVLAGHQAKAGTQRGGMAAQQLEVDLAQARPPTRGRPDEQNAGSLGPRHLIADGDEVIVWLKLDDVRFHAKGL